ncbi:PLP-dependent aminotransferase family protein [Sporichthya sp.]|uniref:MocR-like pyridoxine biosynthesis transcription factor PdxR n=1 Tax=Sporichthya sp. TaxID=65475 RepID=UPI0025FDB0D2|nr:PLP-dependent aminotransferase family protein [Sporichthya sp.]
MSLNAAELLLLLERTPTGPLRVRLATALRDAIRAGQLAPGATMPSTRVLAQDLGVSRGVAVDAYAQLCAEGFLTTRHGSATTVAFRPATAPHDLWTGGEPARPPVPELDLRPGWPDLSAFPRKEWAAAVRDVLTVLPSAALGYDEPWGAWEFRSQLAAYLARVRGAVCAPPGIVVVGGVTQAITLMCRVLLGRGQPRLAVEDPSNPIQRRRLARLGMEVVPIPVDRDGLQVDALARSEASAVLCTPAHQYPCGVSLSPERRASLLRWATEVDGLVLEDDYDADFRYERTPMGCLQGMDPMHVALLGSVSKTLAPALRIGWVVTPPHLLAALRAAKRDDDLGGNTLDQHVLARLLSTGSYDRHLRLLRRRYRIRRDGLVGAFTRLLPDWEILGSAGGLHLTVRPPEGTPENRLVAAAAGLGLAVFGLGAMSVERAPMAGIVLSYARATPDMSAEAVRRLALAMAALDQVTPAMEAAVSTGALPWFETGGLHVPDMR